MVDPARRAKVLRELEQELVPIKTRCTCRLPTSAHPTRPNTSLSVSRVEQCLSRIAAAIESLVPKA